MKEFEKKELKKLLKEKGVFYFIKKIFIWICFLFVVTYESYDLEDGGPNISCITYAKKVFGKIYIIQTDYYKNNGLYRRNKMTFMDFLIPGREILAVEHWFDELRR